MLFNKKEAKNISRDILSIIDGKNIIKRYLLLIIGIFIFATAYNTFLIPNNLIFGGSSSIATIIKDYIDPSLTVLFISIFSLFLGYVFLGKREAVNSIIGALLLPLFINLTSHIQLPVPKDDIMLVSICGAVAIGFANGIIKKTGLSTGGLDTIVQIIEKELKVSYGLAYLCVNSIIIIIGGFTFGYRIMLYALIILYIISIIQDRVMLNISMNKTFFIVTDQIMEVKKYLMKDLGRGVTVLDAKGGFTNLNQEVIMVVIPTIEYFKAKEGILEIDPDAFITICDSYQVYGQDSHRRKGSGKNGIN